MESIFNIYFKWFFWGGIEPYSFTFVMHLNTIIMANIYLEWGQAVITILACVERVISGGADLLYSVIWV